ncbi:MAG: hypothetical protein MK226_04295 [Saprospiraceae bacterium]|jgi:hypothetical protein|nr:hypothetical protein [Saprospiraceae bacterium]
MRKWNWYPAIGLLFIILSAYIGFVPQQSDFLSIILPYLSICLLGLCAYWQSYKEEQIRFWISIAIVARVILVFAPPNLSDDIYRFLWDGYLLNAGINPFDELPSYYIENKVQIQGINKVLFEQLNSPEYFSIYPPVAQFTFAFSTWLFPSSYYGATIIMKLFLLAFEIGNIYIITKLLRYFQLPVKNVLLYALHPLIMVEIIGNLHFEGAMIFFLLFAFWFLVQQKWPWSAVFMSLSIASKLLPLMFLPFLVRRLGWKKAMMYFSFLGVCLLLLFAPLLSNVFFSNFGNSLELYFRRFEFNASIFYLVRWVGYQEVGYNLIKYIGPSLALFTLLVILLATFLERSPSWKTFPVVGLLAITIYNFNTPTVHPWYICLPIMWCIFTEYRYPLVWSVFIFFTYINYSYPDYHENQWVIWIEYIGVWLMLLYDFTKVRDRQLSSSPHYRPQDLET